MPAPTHSVRVAVAITLLSPLNPRACAAASAAENSDATPLASSSELAEVVVTAQKRSESEQSVPLSITTFSGDGIVNIPIIEGRVALRLSGFYDSVPGRVRLLVNQPRTIGLEARMHF